MRRIGRTLFLALHWLFVFAAFIPALGAQLASDAADRLRP